MADSKKRREKGTGNIYQRNETTWTGRINIGTKPDGRPDIKYFSGKSKAEVQKKIREYNKSPHVDPSKITVYEYINNWLSVYKKGVIEDSSYDRLENTVLHQISPHIGTLRLQEVSSDDIQWLLATLKQSGLSYSTVKKAYDCLRAVFQHATIKGDIIRNPMLVVEMPKERLFNHKEIRFFSKKEAALISEEANRLYSTGKPVYPYGNAFILVLNTGLRLGELLALTKSDFDRDSKTLRVCKNLKSVKKRDGGERSGGIEYVVGTTKTYSGERIIPLNDRAFNALQAMCEANVTNEYVICTSNGGVVPPDRLDRSFYRLLKNVGLEKTGVHTLRHTFASFLFDEGVNIKRISEILGHANIQITIDTYVHLLDKVDHDSVNRINNICGE